MLRVRAGPNSIPIPNPSPNLDPNRNPNPNPNPNSSRQLRTLPRKEALPILRVLARSAATAQGGTPG